jgi:hypothetical protein
MMSYMVLSTTRSARSRSKDVLARGALTACKRMYPPELCSDCIPDAYHRTSPRTKDLAL